MKRGTKRLAIGLLLCLAGPLTFVLTFTALSRGAALGDQYPSSGTFSVDIKSAGRYYLWDNYKTVFDGNRIELPDNFPDNVAVEVVDANGNEIKFVRSSKQSWAIGNHAKHSVGYIDVAAPTNASITVRGTDGRRILSVEEADMAGELWRRLRGLAIGMALTIFGLPIALLGLGAYFRGPSEDSTPASGGERDNADPLAS